MTTIDTLRKALEALEADDSKLWPSERRREAITALRAELERMKGVEPVAWGMVNAETGLILDVICPEEHAREPGSYTVPLYTAPIAPAIPALTLIEMAEASRTRNHAAAETLRWAYALAAERAGASVKE